MPRSENSTPSTIEQIQMKFRLQVTALVTFDKSSGRIIKKDIKSVFPVDLLKSEATSSDLSNVSTSISTSCSVYSDKTGLPYKLPPKSSNSTPSVLSNSDNSPESPEDLIPWLNTVLFPLACDMQLPKFFTPQIRFKLKINVKINNKTSLSSEEERTPKLLLSSVKIESVPKVSREEASTEPGEDSSTDVPIKKKQVAKAKKPRLKRLRNDEGKSGCSSIATMEIVSGLPQPIKASKNYNSKRLINVNYSASEKIFQDMNFLMCGIDLEKDEPSPKSSASDSDNSNLYAELDATCPYHEEKLKELIKSGGGRIFNNFSEIPQEAYRKTYLVTNAPNATARFLLAFVHSMTIILHAKLIKVAKGEEELHRMTLDHIGWSTSEQKWLPWPVKKPFAGIRMEVNLSDSVSIDFWRQILQKSGAVLDKRKPRFILSEKQIPEEKGFVTTDWLVQCLFHGSILPLD